MAEPTPDPNAAACNTGCKTDFDRSGTVAVADIFAFLTAWFAGSDCVAGTFPPCPPTTSTASPCFGTSTDYDGSGTNTVGDIFAFLNDWFMANCNP